MHKYIYILSHIPSQTENQNSTASSKELFKSQLENNKKNFKSLQMER